uniref:Bacteriorhodopsin-like protein n=1 Tax=viral metagenome TaxID=1070528 RepID=A0A6C0JJZ5_9ZZZZ
MSTILQQNDKSAENKPKIVPAAPSIALTTPQDKAEIKQNPVQYYVKASFMITYILLLTTATVTFIEAMRTNVPEIRHILNLETCISLVAGYFYSIFTSQIDEFGKKDIPVDWADITKTRYIDWSITTPLMLLVLCIVLGICANRKVESKSLATIIALNYVMLYSGYLGETKQITRMTAIVVGFVAFFAMFLLIFIKLVKTKYCFENYVMFGLYIGIWGLYGVVYLFEESYKNIAMNILDCFAKCFVGLGLWLYYSKTVIL